MTQERKINNSEYQRAAKLLAKMFEFDSDIEKQINDYFGVNGISRFFENLEDTELSTDAIIKLQAVRLVLFGLDDEDSRSSKDGEVNNA